ncbi:MAG: hypothetical protein N2112_10385 [Gemmataceae bacterium]|jgi:hypothetical protein|nr:hypothetical protein [Gemmataceae bacterium]
MILTCPVCQAGNSAPNQCRRCKADLSLVWNLELQRQSLFGQVRVCLAEKNYPRALNLLAELAQLRSDVEVDKLTAAVRLLAGDFAGAYLGRPRE